MDRKTFKMLFAACGIPYFAASIVLFVSSIFGRIFWPSLIISKSKQDNYFRNIHL